MSAIGRRPRADWTAFWTWVGVTAFCVGFYVGLFLGVRDLVG